MTVLGLTPFGTTRRARGRRTTASASTISCCRRKPPTGSSSPASTSTCAAGKSLPTTCRYGPISSSVLEEAVENVPRQPVVNPNPNNVVVELQALVAGKDRTGRRVEIGFVLQADVEIFDLRRPILIELDLDAAARGPAPMPLLVRDGAGRSDEIGRDIGER